MTESWKININDCYLVTVDEFFSDKAVLASVKTVSMAGLSVFPLIT